MPENFKFLSVLYFILGKLRNLLWFLGSPGKWCWKVSTNRDDVHLDTGASLGTLIRVSVNTSLHVVQCGYSHKTDMDYL